MSLVKNRERCFSSCCGTKKKFWVSMRNCNLTPLDSALWCFTFEPQRLYSVQGSLQSSFMTCILLGSAMSIASCFVNRIRKIVLLSLLNHLYWGFFIMFPWGIRSLQPKSKLGEKRTTKFIECWVSYIFEAYWFYKKIQNKNSIHLSWNFIFSLPRYNL